MVFHYFSLVMGRFPHPSDSMLTSIIPKFWRPMRGSLGLCKLYIKYTNGLWLTLGEKFPCNSFQRSRWHYQDCLKKKYAYFMFSTWHIILTGFFFSHGFYYAHIAVLTDGTCRTSSDYKHCSSLMTQHRSNASIVAKEARKGKTGTFYFGSVQFSHSVVSDSLRPHEPQHTRPPCPSPTPGVYPNPCPSSRWCHPTISSSVIPFSFLPSIFPSITIFSNESALCIRWPKYWSLSFNISPSNEHPGLISFRMDWSDLLAVQGTLKSLFQHHSSKASILRCSAFFIIQLSHPYMTTGKTIALTRRTFVGKVILVHGMKLKRDGEG